MSRPVLITRQLTIQLPPDMSDDDSMLLGEACTDLGKLSMEGALGGVWAIIRERLDQIREHGYDAAHDDLHDLAWLGDQAAVRASTGEYADAGALAAAQLDRMARFDNGGH